MTSRPASIQSRGNPDLVIQPVTWIQPNKRPSSSTRSSFQSQKNSPYTISSVDWPTAAIGKSTPRSSAFSQRMPGLIIEGVGPQSGPDSHLPWPTRDDKAATRIPLGAMERRATSPAKRNAPPPKPMPPTAWRQYDQSHSDLPDLALSGSSSTDDESGPSLRAGSDSTWNRDDIGYSDKETVHEPIEAKEEPLNFKLGDSKTIKDLYGPESQTDDERSLSQDSESVGGGTPENFVTCYQSLVPNSPYFEDFDYARPESNLDYDNDDLRGRPAGIGKKTVRFESYESFKTARTGADDDVPDIELDQDSDFDRNVDTSNAQWSGPPFKTTESFHVDKPPEAAQSMADARWNLPSQRLGRSMSTGAESPALSEITRQATASEEPTSPVSPEEELQPGIAVISNEVQRSLPSPHPPFQEARVTWSTIPNPRRLSPSPHRTSAGSPLSQNPSSNSLVTLQQQQPRHPLAFSQLPPPSPSTTPDNSAHPPAVSEPMKAMVEKRQRNKLRKRKQSIAQSSLHDEPKCADAIPPSGTDSSPTEGVQPVSRPPRSSSSHEQNEQGLVSQQIKSESETESLEAQPSAETKEEPRTDPKYKHLASAVLNYYRPSKTASLDTDQPNSSGENKSSTPPTSYKPRRRSFRASGLFSRSRRSSDAQDISTEKKRVDDNSLDSRSSSRPSSSKSIALRFVSGQSPIITPVSASPDISRDASPNRLPPGPDYPKTFQALSYSKTSHSTRSSMKGEPSSIPPIPAVPAHHRNSSPIPSSSVSSTGSSSSNAPVIPAGKYPPGNQLVSVADLAAFNNSGSEVLIFRRFDSVHKRILNDMQERIVTLESELSQLDQFLSDSTDSLNNDQNQKQPSSGQLGPEGDIARARSRRLTLIHDLKWLLRDYDDLLLKFNNMRLPPGDQKNAINKFKSWLSKNGSSTTNSSVASSGSTTPTTARPSSLLSSYYPAKSPHPSRPTSSSSTVSTATPGPRSPNIRPVSSGATTSSSQTNLPRRATTVTASTSRSSSPAPTQARTLGDVDPNLKLAAAVIMGGGGTAGKQTQDAGELRRPRTARRGLTG